MRSITTKLVLAFITVSLISIALVMLFTRWRNGEEFRSFLFDQNRPSIITSLSDYYGKYGSWQGITDMQFQVQPPPSRPEPHKSPFTLVDESGRIVYAGQGYQVGDIVTASELNDGIPIQANDRTVGRLLISRSNFPVGAPGSDYLDRFNRQIFLSGLIAIALALLLAIILSRTLTRPIRELTAATQVVSVGDLAQQVPVRSRDELGQLATSFNRMSSDLARSLNLRRQMTADIAHELRTPISIILGHAEAVHDGILPASSETFEIIREEAERLEHLVDDLRTLSMADAGELKLAFRPYAPQKLLRDAQKIYSHQARQKKVSIQTKAESDLPEIEVEPERMKEVLGNIIDNALRYTPENGQITLSARRVADMIELRVQDSGPGVAPDELDRIFERFYRIETSRARDTGGSGLGFAIAKSLVEKHNGRIWAESKPGEGLTILIRLPVSKS
ncbi:MAG: HAMP domain-containing protein [Chloroflexi bacterium]|nr:HAMP domain-containing protein [Chloroflexota bacterium]